MIRLFHTGIRMFMASAFLFYIPAKATEPPFKKQINEGYLSVYDFNFRKADSIVSCVLKEAPEDENGFLLAANLYWWKLRTGEDSESMRKQFMAALTVAEGLLKKKNSPLCDEDLFHCIQVYSFMSRLELLSEHYFSAFSYVNKCNKYLFTSFGKEDRYEPFCLTSGLYHYSVVAAKKKYPPLIPFLIMLPPADKKTGLQLIAKAGNSEDEILRTEGNYFQMVIFGESDVDLDRSAGYAEELTARYPANLLFRYYLFSVLLQSGKKEKAMLEYKRLYAEAWKNTSISVQQQKYFLVQAQKDLEHYYIKHPND